MPRRRCSGCTARSTYATAVLSRTGISSRRAPTTVSPATATRWVPSIEPPGVTRRRPRATWSLAGRGSSSGRSARWVATHTSHQAVKCSPSGPVSRICTSPSYRVARCTSGRALDPGAPTRRHATERRLPPPRIDAAGVVVPRSTDDPGHGTPNRFAGMVSEVAGSWIDVVAAEAPATSADTTPLRGHSGAVPGSRPLASGLRGDATRAGPRRSRGGVRTRAARARPRRPPRRPGPGRGPGAWSARGRRAS